MPKISNFLSTLAIIYSIFASPGILYFSFIISTICFLSLLKSRIMSYVTVVGLVVWTQTTLIYDTIVPSNSFASGKVDNDISFTSYEKRHLLTFCTCFLCFRGLSSAIDCKESIIKEPPKSIIQKVINIVDYLLYMPGFFFGPLFRYSDYHKITRNRDKYLERKSYYSRQVLINLALFVSSYLIYDYSLHWQYSSAFLLDATNEEISLLDHWQFIGLILALILSFYAKYVCIYGLFKFLSHLDGIGDISPPLPSCVLTMHLPSQIWRGFDVGLYHWLLEYIYKPSLQILGSSKILSPAIASLASFIFVGTWHMPINRSILTWILMNYICAVIEIVAKNVGKTFTFKNHRTIALLSLPLYIVTIISTQLFLSPQEYLVVEFMRRIGNMQDDFPLYFIMIVYCGINVSIKVRKRLGT